MDIAMKSPVLCFLGSLAMLYFGVVAYALYQGRDVKASLKMPFAVFSFETKAPDTGKESRTLKSAAGHEAAERAPAP
jgi:hypothetical protein